jgi:hypothetical protein
MNATILNAKMEQHADSGYVGQVQFTLESHKSTYEITFFSKKGRDWDYSLNFAQESGSEEELLAADALIEEDDELFDQLLDAVEAHMNK